MIFLLAGIVADYPDYLPWFYVSLKVQNVPIVQPLRSVQAV
jgi:hypothetical protein